MAVTLAATINATQNHVTLTEALVAQPGDLFRIENEVVEFGGYGRIAPEMRLPDHSGKVVIFTRGMQGTTAATHTSTTAVLRVADGLVSSVGTPDPFVAGGGAGAVASVNGQTGAVVLDAGDVSAQPADAFLADLSGYANFAALVDALKPHFLEPD